MNSNFIVYKGQIYSNYGHDKRGYYLTCPSGETPPVGYEKIVERFVTYQNYKTGEIDYGESVTYRKYLLCSDIDQIYQIVDSALYKGFEIPIYESSDDNHDQPDSYVRLHIDFRSRNLGLDKETIEDLLDGAQEFREKYNEEWYATRKIPVSEVTILRRRKNLPI